MTMRIMFDEVHVDKENDYAQLLQLTSIAAVSSCYCGREPRRPRRGESTQSYCPRHEPGGRSPS